MPKDIWTRRSRRRGVLVVALFAPLSLYACGALKDGDDRAQLSDAGDGANDARGDALGDAVDDHDASIVDARGDAMDATDVFDAADATDATDAIFDSEADGVDGGGPVLVDAPVGTPIPLALGSSTFWLYGFTSDGFFIYEDGPAVYAVPLAGGPRELIYVDAVDPSALPSARIEESVVVVNTGGQTSHPAVVWTHAMGPLPIPSNVLQVEASRDGSRLGYLILNRTADGGIGDYQFGESDLDFANAIFFPILPSTSFPYSLTASAAHFLVARMSSDPDASASAYGVDSYSNTGTQTHILDNVSFWTVQDEVVARYGYRSIQARSASGGPMTTINVPGDGGALDPLGVTPDGAHIVFGDGTAGFWSSPTSSASPVNLPGTDALAGGYSYLVMAPDSIHFAAWQKSGQALVATLAPGGAITIPYSAATGQFLTSPDFSADSRYLFASNTALTALSAIAVDTGVWTRISLDVDCSGRCWQRAHGATVLYLTNGSLFSVDVDHIASPTKLGDSVVRFKVNAAGTVAVSLVKDPASEAASGLFAVNVP